MFFELRIYLILLHLTQKAECAPVQYGNDYFNKAADSELKVARDDAGENKLLNMFVAHGCPGYYKNCSDILVNTSKPSVNETENNKILFDPAQDSLRIDHMNNQLASKTGAFSSSASTAYCDWERVWIDVRHLGCRSESVSSINCSVPIRSTDMSDAVFLLCSSCIAIQKTQMLDLNLNCVDSTGTTFRASQAVEIVSLCGC